MFLHRRWSVLWVYTHGVNDYAMMLARLCQCIWVWVWLWVRLRPMDYVPSKGRSMAPNPSESALVASLQARLFHWMTFPTGANTHPEKALLDWFAEDAIATARLRKCTFSAASPATIFLLYSIQIQWKDANLQLFFWQNRFLQRGEEILPNSTRNMSAKKKLFLYENTLLCP